MLELCRRKALNPTPHSAAEGCDNLHVRVGKQVCSSEILAEDYTVSLLHISVLEAYIPRVGGPARVMGLVPSQDWTAELSFSLSLHHHMSEEGTWGHSRKGARAL